MREGASIALEVCPFDRDDRPLHAHVLIRWRFCLRAQTESARLLQQLRLSRRPSRYDPDLASRLIGVPNRYRKRPASLFRNADDSHVKICQECLAFFLCHRGWHARLLRSAEQRSAQRKWTESSRNDDAARALLHSRGTWFHRYRT